MKPHTKSSIPLPPEELKLVKALQDRLKVRSKVEVVRRGLRLLQETMDSAVREFDELDHLAGECLDAQ
jgi:hypothetical protein